LEPQPVKINDIYFEPKPGIKYGHRYWQVVDDIAKKEADEWETWRNIFVFDSWAFMYFIMGTPKLCEMLNRPFIVQACREIDATRKINTLDLWAREHFKSTAITTALSIQDVLLDPETCVGIFSHTRPAALKFFAGIKQLLEGSEFLKWLYPDRLYQNPEKEAFRWSEDGGLYLKRKSLGRKEATFEACGLVEGMPTGRHFDLRVYDDVETHDSVQTPEMIRKVKDAFDMSHNLGTDGGVHRVIGTTYHHEGLLQHLRNRVREDGASLYHTRVKTATVDGTPNGASSFLSEGKLAELRVNRQMFFSQQLLNPTPAGEQKLEFDHIKRIKGSELPSSLYKFMVIDPAGTRKDRQSDSWAIFVVGVERSIDEIGASNIYLLDGVVAPMDFDEAMKTVIDVYLRNGKVQTIGVEKAAMMTTEVHIANALRAKGKYVTVEGGGITLLRPGGRNKQDRIEGNLMWPLNNGKIHIVEGLSNAVVERIRIEMSRYPFWHDDAIDAMSYIFDLIKDFKFGKIRPSERKELSLWERIERAKGKTQQGNPSTRWMYV